MAETAGNEKFCEAFKDSLDAQERADQMIETIKDQREEIEKLKSDKSGGETVVEVDARTETNVDQSTNAHSESSSSSSSSAIASAQSKQEVVNNVNEFIEILDNNLESGIEGSSVPNPPEDPSNLEKTKQWLDDFVNYVNTGSNVAKAASLLAPTAKELLPAVAALI